MWVSQVELRLYANMEIPVLIERWFYLEILTQLPGSHYLTNSVGKKVGAYYQGPRALVSSRIYGSLFIELTWNTQSALIGKIG